VNDENPLRTASKLALAGRTAEAIACLESALARTRSNKERPANASLLARTAGLLCEEAGRLSLAARYYEEAVATPDGDPVLLLALADVRWRLGQTDSARSFLARAESMAQLSFDADALKMVANIRARWASDNS
jgi:tetratricopeptide (TPR) repeat protein